MTDKNNNGLNDGENQQPKNTKFNLFTGPKINPALFPFLSQLKLL